MNMLGISQEDKSRQGPKKIKKGLKSRKSKEKKEKRPKKRPKKAVKKEKKAMESDGRTSVQCIAFHGLGSIAEALHKMSDLTSSSPEGRGFRLSGRNR
jgi:hypothetical protein